MKLKNNIVYWKSIPEMYKKELLGEKANTIRILSQQEYQDLIKNPPTKIIICNTETELRFRRRLSDVTYFKLKLINSIRIGIFSWRS